MSDSEVLWASLKISDKRWKKKNSLLLELHHLENLARTEHNWDGFVSPDSGLPTRKVHENFWYTLYNRKSAGVSRSYAADDQQFKFLFRLLRALC